MSAKGVVCDFCCSPSVKWRFRAESFIAWSTPYMVSESVGDWAACDVCRELVEAEDKEGLLRQSWEALLYDHPEILALQERYRRDLRDFIKKRHLQFFEHRLQKEAIPA